MTGLLPFGTRVALTHVTRAVYLTWKTHDDVFDPPTSAGAFVLVRKVERDKPVLVRAGEYLGDPERDVGLDLPEPSGQVPASGRHRRLRRWPSDAEGVVVGRTYRIEGFYSSGYNGPYGEEEPPFLCESRRVWVYSVALEPDRSDRTAWPVALVMAVPQDVHPLLSVAEVPA